MMPFEKYDVNGKRDINSATTMFDFDSKNRIISRKSFISNSIFNISSFQSKEDTEANISQGKTEECSFYNNMLSVDLNPISQEYITRIGYKRGNEKFRKTKTKERNLFESIDKYNLNVGNEAYGHVGVKLKEGKNLGNYKNIGEENPNSTKKHRFVKSLYILSEILLFCEYQAKLDTKPNLSKELSINFKGFYDFSEFDFSFVVDDIEHINISHYLNTIYFLPDAEIDRICLKNLWNCFYFWINQKRKDLQLSLLHIEYLDCECH